MSEGGIEVEDDLYGFPSDRGGGELAFLLIYLFMVFFVGIGTSVITFLSWLKGLLLTHYRIGSVILLNITIVDMLFLCIVIFMRAITISADRWFFGKMGCGFFPLAEEYLLITRTAMFLILALYPAFCNNMPDGGPCWIMRTTMLVVFIWVLGWIPVISAISQGFGMHIEYGAIYGGCAIHTPNDTFYKPSLFLFTTLTILTFLVLMVIRNGIILYREKKLWFNPAGVPPSNKQLAFWLGLACTIGYIPFIVISCITFFKDSESLPKEVHLFQLCWYYGCILLTPIILYRVDDHFREFFRYIVLGKESVSDPKVYECGLKNLRLIDWSLVQPHYNLNIKRHRDHRRVKDHDSLEHI